MTIVKTIQEAVAEISKQLLEKDFYMHNYRLLDGVQDFLDNCLNKNDTDFDEMEQIYNYVAYDLKWEDREDELFPMEL
jgi:hypothetical protein